MKFFTSSSLPLFYRVPIDFTFLLPVGLLRATTGTAATCLSRPKSLENKGADGEDDDAEGEPELEFGGHGELGSSQRYVWSNGSD